VPQIAALAWFGFRSFRDGKPEWWPLIKEFGIKA